MHHKKNKN